jgi:RNA polymerase sigma-70 factor (ECF subfamily)
MPWPGKTTADWDCSLIDSTTTALQSQTMRAACTVEPVEGCEAVPAQRDAGTAASEKLNDYARQALRGNDFALRQFLQAITPQVRGICRRIMGRENTELEDAIQECVIDVARALPQFRFEADVSHYVTKIAARRASDVAQRSRTRSQRYAAIDSCAIPVMTFDDGLEARANLVRHLLDKLGEPQSTVLRLRLMLGHSTAEIARITGVSVNTVKTRLRLGKVFLRRQLEKSGEPQRAP